MHVEEYIILSGLIFAILFGVYIFDECKKNFLLYFYKDYDFDKHIIYRNGVQYIDIGKLPSHLAKVYLIKLSKGLL